jgi:hypothetical protein
MEGRLSKRVDVKIKADFILGGKTYYGSIKNVSESGLGYLITSSLLDTELSSPMKSIEICFQAPSGQTYNLSCRTVWFSKTLPHGNTLVLGMKIIDPPKSYKEWIKQIM